MAPCTRDSKRGSILGLLSGALLALACAPAPPAAPIQELARGFRPRPLPELAREWDGSERAERSRSAERETFEWSSEYVFPKEAWERRSTAYGELWFAPLPGGHVRYADRARMRLRRGDAEWARAPRFGALPAGGFLVEDEGVLLEAAGSEAPDGVVLAVQLSSGEEREGVWHVRVGEFTGAGIPVWSGQREALTCAVPPASQLSFTLRHTGVLATRPATFRVHLGAQLLWQGQITARLAREWHTLELPAQGLERAELVFEVEGPPGLGCFASPVIAPRARGDYGARPWPEPRPNVVLFLADTFRADNLEAYGGTEGATPALDRLAEESVCFVEARSSASWTLPSLGAILTGYYPVQVGINDEAQKIAEDIDTLAERFARAGYRTGAVTDAVYFSAAYGLNQGFGWFRPREFDTWSLDDSLEDARSFLAGDDGRPVFLVFHTYRAHEPYRTGHEEDASAFEALKAEALRTFDRTGAHAKGGLGLEQRAQVRALYMQGVRVLDERFGSFRRLLEERRVLTRGYLAFTADHGEAFGENGVMRHGGALWDSRIRVPLLVHGHDLAPRRVPWSVSNVDLAPTLARLAALAPDERWPGTSLLEADRDRSVFAFRLNAEQIAVVEGRRKLLASGLEELAAGRAMAFDLDTDRGEERSLGDQEWAAELARRSAPRVRSFLEHGLRGSAAELDANDLETLQELGYGGEHSDER